MTRSIRGAMLTIATLIAGIPATVGAVTCYTLYDRSDAVVYRGTFPPIDMSPEGDTQRDAMRATGQFLVFADADSCPPVEYRFGDAGTKNLSMDNIIGGIRPMAVNRSGMPASSPAPRSGR
ncbi:MAG: DUF3426 domain-containing protein [Pseudomonadota bacterium]|nr:DUF3426 domain-containing protein [Pseudomonadota bacterium]